MKNTIVILRNKKIKTLVKRFLLKSLFLKKVEKKYKIQEKLYI